MRRNIEIPIWEQYSLTIEESAVYFRIGENTLREIIKNNPDSDFWFWNGNRKQIKRRLFEEFMDKQNVI